LSEDPFQQRDPEEQPAPEEPEGPPPQVFVRFGLLFYGVMAAAAVVWRIGFYGEPLLYADAGAAAAGVDPARDVGLGLAVGAAVVVLSHVATRGTDWGERLARSLASGIGRLDTSNAVLLAFASGLAEEMFFRGALQPRVGLVAASLLFGLLHFAPRRELAPWTVFAVIVGGVFGWLFEWTGNLVAPVVAHTTINAINLPMLARRYGEGGSGDVSPPDPPGR